MVNLSLNSRPVPVPWLSNASALCASGRGWGKPPLSNGQMWKKSAPNHPGKPLHPRATWIKRKCPKPSWQAFTPHSLKSNAHMETTHFKMGLPLYGLCFITFGDISEASIKLVLYHKMSSDWKSGPGKRREVFECNVPAGFWSLNFISICKVATLFDMQKWLKKEVYTVKKDSVSNMFKVLEKIPVSLPSLYPTCINTFSRH